MHIRKATLADENQVIGLLKKLLTASEELKRDLSDVPVVFRQIVDNPELGAILVAEEDAEIAGVTTLSFPTAIRCNGIYSCIEENIVDEKFRGKGVGGKLLQAAIAEASARGCDELQVNNPSKQGYPLYMRHGLEDKGKHLNIKLSPQGTAED
jgi:GNAT superfamily N-acetyltransferase